MAKPTLTPEEVESLVGGRPEAVGDPATRAASQRPAPPHPAPAEALPPPADVLPELRERVSSFRRRLAVVLSEALRAEVTVTVQSAERRSAGYRRLGVEAAGCYVTLRSASSGLALLVGWDLELLFSALERLLGGGRRPSRVIRRPLTDIEKRLAGRLATLVAGAWQHGSGEADAPAWAAERIDAKPPREPLSESRSPVAVLRCSIAFGGVAGGMSLDVPWVLAARPSASPVADAAAAQPTLELTAVLAELQLSAHEVQDLQVGDVIETDTLVSQPIAVTLNKQPIFEGHPGTAEGRKAVRLQ